MQITLELPEDIGLRLLENRAAAELPLLRELAVALYRKGQLPPGRAAELAGMNRWEWERFIAESSTPMPYTREMAEGDLHHGGNRF
jgi:predicted HTH domain antitoxin